MKAEVAIERKRARVEVMQQKDIDDDRVESLVDSDLVTIEASFIAHHDVQFGG